MFAGFFVALQYVLPKYWLTALVWRLARIRQTRIKNFLIKQFVDLFDVDLTEVEQQVPEEFATFNEFFTRELKSGARSVDPDPAAIVSPVDGTLSVAAGIQLESMFQAKNIDYSLTDLLATDLDQARAFADGSFATIYLAPFNYHRVHAPFDADLTSAHYVPGDLFSVNAATVQRVDGLFRRNERLVMHFNTEFGPAALVFVGALNVGSITTPWSDEIRARKRGVVEALDLSRHSCSIRKGDLLGWFNMGSTVILLLPAGAADWNTSMKTGASLRMGAAIATVSGAKSGATV